jgi:hypothetical protein
MDEVKALGCSKSALLTIQITCTPTDDEVEALRREEKNLERTRQQPWERPRSLG